MQATSVFERIRELLHQKADLNARLRLIPYEGTPEVKPKGEGRYFIAHGGGLLVAPEADVARFKELLVGHYEGTATAELTAFMKERCWRKLG